VENTLDQLPIRPETHRRIRLYYLDTEGGGTYESSPQARDTFVAELESRGFQVTLNDGASRVKGATLAYRDEVDAAIVVANIVGYAAANNCPIRWKTPMSTGCPWYVHEVPTVMVSLNHTTHLHDATTPRRHDGQGLHQRVPRPRPGHPPRGRQDHGRVPVPRHLQRPRLDREVAGEALTDRGLASIDVTPRSRRHTGYRRCDVKFAV